MFEKTIYRKTFLRQHLHELSKVRAKRVNGTCVLVIKQNNFACADGAIAGQ
jgi:hypothetical protein